MNVQIELWHVISLMLTALGGYWTLAKIMASQAQRHLDERFAAQEAARQANYQQLAARLDAIEKVGQADAMQWQRVERELLSLKADLPLNYVRREDYVQAVATIMAKLDAMSMRFENILLRGSKNHD